MTGPGYHSDYPWAYQDQESEQAAEEEYQNSLQPPYEQAQQQGANGSQMGPNYAVQQYGQHPQEISRYGKTEQQYGPPLSTFDAPQGRHPAPRSSLGEPPNCPPLSQFGPMPSRLGAPLSQFGPMPSRLGAPLSQFGPMPSRLANSPLIGPEPRGAHLTNFPAAIKLPTQMHAFQPLVRPNPMEAPSESRDPQQAARRATCILSDDEEWIPSKLMPDFFHAFTRSTLFQAADGKSKEVADEKKAKKGKNEEAYYRKKEEYEAKWKKRQSVMKTFSEIYPQLRRICCCLLTRFYSVYAATNIGRDPLLHYSCQQFCQWCLECNYRLIRKNISADLIRLALLNLINLQYITLLKNPLVAAQVAKLLRVYATILAELQVHLEKLSEMPPIDYSRLVDICVVNTAEKLTGRDVKDAVDICPAVSDFVPNRLLGAGGFGAVYKAVYKPANVVCTLKLVAVSCYPTIEHAIVDRVVASITDHPLMVNYFCCIPAKNVHVTIMEYIKGLDLQRVVDKAKQLRVEQMQIIAAQMVAALQHMHFMGLMHRDIKASNALILGSGKIKLIDFDTAKIGVGHFTRSCFRHFYDRTQAEYNDREKAGTLPYMAPEIVKYKPYGRAADLWSLGITFYKLLFGRVPFRGETEEEIHKAILTNPLKIPKLKKQSTAVQNAIDFISRLLIRPAEKRLGSASYKGLIEHPLLATFKWKMLEDDIVVKLESYKEVMKGIIDKKSSKEGTVDPFNASPEASPKTQKKDLLKPEDIQTKSSAMKPILTYMSLFFRRAVLTGKSPEQFVSSTPILDNFARTERFTIFSKTDDLSRVEAEKCRIVILSESGPSLGFKVLLVTCDQGATYPIVISIDREGEAYRSYLIEGDVIIAINSQSTVNRPIEYLEKVFQSKRDYVISVLSSSTFRVFASRIDMMDVLSCFQRKEITITTDLARNNVEQPIGIEIPWLQADVHNAAIVTRHTKFFDQKRNEYMKSHIVLYVNPAVSADLYAGDVIFAINSEQCPFMSTEDVAGRLQSAGPIGIEIVPMSPLRKNRPRLDRLLRTYTHEGRESYRE